MRWRERVALHDLARRHGICTAYLDMFGRCQAARPETLLATLRALGVPLTGMADVPVALSAWHRAHWSELCDPVIVAWDGLAVFDLRLAASLRDEDAVCTATGEDGTTRRWTVPLDALRVIRRSRHDGHRGVVRRWTLPERLPIGYHRFRLEAGGASAEGVAIAAPRRAYQPDPASDRLWGAFVPLYAVRSERNWGVGDLTDLQRLAAWTHGLGGRVIGTLPLLAGFMEEPFESSPYAPVSRRFWNELYLDVTALPEWSVFADIRAMAETPAFAATLDAQRAGDWVDHRMVMRAKRRVLEAMAERLLAEGHTVRRQQFEVWRAAHPEAEHYARFRAVVDQRRCGWSAWPSPLRDGTVRDTDYAAPAIRYHLFAQWAMHEQLAAASQALRQDGMALYLDVPLGVHREGFDTWDARDVFALDAAAGAPPDKAFRSGQHWGFAPLHPERIRRQGYRYVIDGLRAQLAHAGRLRIDHVMQFHRVFWIPQGGAVADGVYVRYPAEEYYAIVSVESHRARAVIVGEDLGIVPPEVGPAMARHGLHRMCVIEYAAAPRRVPVSPPPSGAVASVNTHDLPPFAAYWQGLDIPQRERFGLLPPEAAAQEARTRQRVRERLMAWLRSTRVLPHGALELPAIFDAVVTVLARSRSELVLINLEDLWLETRSQNVPGTGPEARNWSRKTRYGLEALEGLPAVRNTLERLQTGRGGNHGG